MNEFKRLIKASKKKPTDTVKVLVSLEQDTFKRLKSMVSKTGLTMRSIIEASLLDALNKK